MRLASPAGPIVAILGAALLLTPTAGPAAEEAAKDGPAFKVPEVVEMAWSIARGSQMGPNDGWFHPSRGRYGWDWLASRFDADRDGAIFPEEFRGPPAFFERLDRDRDGAITAEDLDWSDRSTYLRQAAPAHRVFAMTDANRNGRVSREEWLALFDKAASGKASLSPEDLRRVLVPPAPPRRATSSPGFLPGDAPTRPVLLRGLLKGEIGSHREGPRPGRLAPDFTLTTQDGGRTVTLSDFRGKRPVVLIFGNFTCGPFRSNSGALDDLYRRYGDRAEFLAVYVREAHPTDGWRMASNDRVGVSFAQPRVKADRDAAARSCRRTLEMAIPLLVDDLDDRVGHAYSGMPDRLYVLDRSGLVSYQSGRGPFGFKPGEAEQALVMLLLDQETPGPEPVARP